MLAFFLFLLGIMIGFLVSLFFSGKEEGKKGRLPSWKFSFKSYTVHLHHWFLISLLLIGLWFIDVTNPLIFGLLVGSITQGLTYRDFYKIIYKKKKE